MTRMGPGPATRQLIPAVCLALALVALSSPGVLAQTLPPTLTGETFLGGQFAPGTSSVVVTSASCNPSGTSTFTYSATGPSSGPYTGTYSETGTATIGPQTFPGTPPSGLVTSWSANFTITSTVGNVIGTKSLIPGTAPAGICEDGLVGFIAQRSAATGAQNLLAYTAVITISGGDQFLDHGGSQASVNVFPTFSPFNNFFENFTSQQVTPTPVCDEDDQGDQVQDLDDQGCAN